jgi:hypothetical protein
MSFKKSTLLFCFLTAVITSYSQTSAQLPQEMIDSSEFKSLLFTNFMDGAVLMKSGSVEKAPMNYNAKHQCINFINAGKYYTLTGLEEIDTIYIQHKRFIPVKNDIYEMVNELNKSTSLLVSYTTRTRPLVSTADHNGAKKQVNNQVSNTVSNTYVNQNYKNNSTIELKKHFWIKIGQNIYKADTKTQLRKVFPHKSKKEIDNYINSNNLNLMVDSDLIKLIEFLSKR